MRLNADCLRTVLLYIEEYTYLTMDDKMKPLYHNVGSRQVIEKCEELGFSAEDAFYSIVILHEKGYIEATPTKVHNLPVSYEIDRLTPAGHDFLSSIRSPETYSHVKAIVDKMGGFTLETLVYVSRTVFTEMVKRQIFPQ